MTAIQPGRVTAPSERDVTVFLIGLRFNRPWLVHRWLPVVVAMPRMLAHLETHPEHGMLGCHQWFGRTTMLLSYWESPEHLQRFASDADSPHLEPWRTFNRRALGAAGTVGIYHETYVTHPGGREVLYVDMPAFGLAAATGSVPADAGLRTARQRMAAQPVTPSPGSEIPVIPKAG